MTKYDYKIQPIILDNIVQYNKKKYNSNNHWVNDIMPDDYEHVISQTDTSKWIDLFKPGTMRIKITNQIWIEWLKKAHEISCQTGRFTKLYEDEIQTISDQLNNMYPNIFGIKNKNKNGIGIGNGNGIMNNVGYFVRVNNVSLKYGEHKEGQYYSFKQILESAVSCIKGHSPIKEHTNELVIYFLDWIEIDPCYEFRVFVFENKITAMSQQNIYSILIEEDVGNSDKTVFENKIKLKLDFIVDYFYSQMIHKINWINCYTFDFAIVNSNPYFIELNSFGKEYASGSALFHWLLDEKILYNKFETNNVIEFRYTK